MSPADLGPVAWALLVLGALLVGFAKTAVGGAGALAVACFALAVPARESTGALLPLLCLGDVIAVRVYHRHANWRILLRLLPGVIPGLLLGSWFLSVADDEAARKIIGAVLLVMCGLQVWLRRNRAAWENDEVRHQHLGWTFIIGVVAGFATMAANAAGPVTTLYLLAAGLPMLEFLGTAAWFYLVVNALKLPFSASLDLLTWSAVATDALLVPALLVGAGAGMLLVRRINQSSFEQIALWLTVIAAGALLV